MSELRERKRIAFEQERIRRNNENIKRLYEMKCWWTRPLGHIWVRSDVRLRRGDVCAACGKEG